MDCHYGAGVRVEVAIGADCRQFGNEIALHRGGRGYLFGIDGFKEARARENS